MTASFRQQEEQQRQQRLTSLLSPIHDQVRLSARRLCRSHSDGDDLFQEAALRALSRLDDLRDATRFRAWFYAVLLSVHRQRSRRDFWRRCVPFLSNDSPSNDAPEPSINPNFEETRGESARLRAALMRLPAKQREAVVLFEVDGYSIEEVAELQGDSVPAVKSRLCRGRQRLREHYAAIESADAAPAARHASGEVENEPGHG